MRAIRLVLLLLLGLATMPACTTPLCHDAPAQARHSGHHGGTRTAPDDTAPIAATCIGCAIALPEPATIAAPLARPAPAFPAASVATLAGIDPKALAPPPRSLA